MKLPQLLRRRQDFLCVIMVFNIYSLQTSPLLSSTQFLLLRRRHNREGLPDLLLPLHLVLAVDLGTDIERLACLGEQGSPRDNSVRSHNLHVNACISNRQCQSPSAPPLQEPTSTLSHACQTYLLVVIDVSRALLAVVAADTFAGIALVSVDGRLTAARDLESRFGDDLVHGEGPAAEDLAGVAVAQDVGALVFGQGDIPLVVAAVAFAVVGSHDDDP